MDIEEIKNRINSLPSGGLTIVLSGTDSLGFVFSEDEQLYDRCVLFHTTFIPFREFENVLGIRDIDEYIV